MGAVFGGADCEVCGGEGAEEFADEETRQIGYVVGDGDYCCGRASEFHCVEHWTAEAGPVIGARAGPGVVGLCWYREDQVT